MYHSLPSDSSGSAIRISFTCPPLDEGRGLELEYTEPEYADEPVDIAFIFLSVDPDRMDGDGLEDLVVTCVAEFQDTLFSVCLPLSFASPVDSRLFGVLVAE